jgi:hypothetical protein
MLTTEEADGSMRSRPLATLQFDSEGVCGFSPACPRGRPRVTRQSGGP